MENIDGRTKFWVTDPPAAYEDEEQSIAYLLVFSTRRLLLDYYKMIADEGVKKFSRSSPIQKRWAQLVYYVQALGWQGINIDPDPTGEGPSKLVEIVQEVANAAAKPAGGWTLPPSLMQSINAELALSGSEAVEALADADPPQGSNPVESA